MKDQPISPQDPELKRRLRRASTKARFGGVAFILMGAMFLTLGYFTNTPSQRQFDSQMNSRSTIADPIINNVPPLAAGRALSSPLMALMPFVFMGLGLLSVGMGIKTVAQGASPVERQDIGEEFRIEQLIHARQNNKQTSPDSTVDSSLRFDGVYVLGKDADCEWKYLIFFKSGRVRIPSTSLTPIRALVEESRKDASDSSVGGWSTANYKLSDSTVSFSVPPLPKVCGRELTGAIEPNRLRLKIEYFSESGRNLYTPKTVEYSFFPIPIE
jgi:hypothetical protein